MKFLKENSADMTAQGGIVVAVTTMIGIAVCVLIWYKLNASLYTGKAVTGWATPGMNTTWASINTTANSVWTLAPIIAIVVMAGIILAVVMGFGRNQA